MKKHVATVEVTDDGYTAECVCGWEGPQRDSEEEAKSDIGEHYDDMESEA